MTRLRSTPCRRRVVASTQRIGFLLVVLLAVLSRWAAAEVGGIIANMRRRRTNSDFLDFLNRLSGGSGATVSPTPSPLFPVPTTLAPAFASLPSTTAAPVLSPASPLSATHAISSPVVYLASPASTSAPIGVAYEQIVKRDNIFGSDAVIFLSRCSDAQIPLEATTVVKNVVQFTYKLYVQAEALHEEQISKVEGRLNDFLSRTFLGDCKYNTRFAFQVYSMSSEPVDTVGTVCDNDITCRIIDGGITTQYFYEIKNRVRSLQATTFSDEVLAETFGLTLKGVMSNDTLTNDSNVTKLEFIAFTNFAVSDPNTFGGVDPATNGQVSGIRSDAAENGELKVSWGAAMLGMAVVALLLTGGVILRKRRRGRKRLARAYVEDPNRFTYEDPDESGVKGVPEDHQGPGFYVEAYSANDIPESPLRDSFDEDRSPSRGHAAYVLNDLACDGTEVGLTIERDLNGSFLQENRSPPLFVSTDTNRSMEDMREERYDPYGRPYSTPDTLDL
jgi:hypothetical protein